MRNELVCLVGKKYTSDPRNKKKEWKRCEGLVPGVYSANSYLL